jgi:hypothetical protein
MATATKTVKVPAKKAVVKTSPNPDLTTTTKKSLDSMSEAHRRHIERWEPFLSLIGGEHVWAATPRFAGRGEGAFFLAVKIGPKNYGIAEFDTSKKLKAKYVVKDVVSPKAILTQFGEYRKTAKAERDAARAASKSKAKAKPTAKAPAKKKVVVRKTASKAS